MNDQPRHREEFDPVCMRCGSKDIVKVKWSEMGEDKVCNVCGNIIMSRNFQEKEKTVGKSTEERVKEIISEQLGVDVDDVTHDASMEFDLGADSFDRVEVLLAIEEDFGIEIPDQDAAMWMNAGDAIRYVNAKVNGR